MIKLSVIWNDDNVPSTSLPSWVATFDVVLFSFFTVSPFVLPWYWIMMTMAKSLIILENVKRLLSSLKLQC